MTSTRVFLALCTSIVLLFACESAHAQTTCISEPATTAVSAAPFRTWMSVRAAPTVHDEREDVEIALAVVAASLAAVGVGLMIAGFVMNDEDAIPFILSGAMSGALGVGLALLAALDADARAERARMSPIALRF